jgi:hypothetical protein
MSCVAEVFCRTVIRNPTNTEDNMSRDEGEVVITFKPDATGEEKDKFLSEMAYAITALARHLVALEEENEEDGPFF